MRRILHLSDLHFGHARPDLLDPLIEAVNRAGADLVAISGDLTQRARNWQFKAARDFIDRIEAPTLVVPGNHDTPLDNLVVRILRPWVRYRRWIGEDLEPVFTDSEMTVAGINTVNPFRWQSGKIDEQEVRRVCEAMGDPGHRRWRIIVAHHPFEPSADSEKRPMQGASDALRALTECAVDIVLTGHLHNWHAEPFAERLGRRGALQIYAGTSLSTRLRSEENDFNLISLEGDTALVERFAASETATRFEPAERAEFQLDGDHGWRVAAVAPTADPAP